MFGYYMTGILLIALGIFLFVRPDLMWKLTEQWKSYSADEPSDLYLLSTKIGGILLGIVGIAVLVLPFLLE